MSAKLLCTFVPRNAEMLPIFLSSKILRVNIKNNYLVSFLTNPSHPMPFSYKMSPGIKEPFPQNVSS